MKEFLQLKKQNQQKQLELMKTAAKSNIDNIPETVGSVPQPSMSSGSRNIGKQQVYTGLGEIKNKIMS